MEEESRRVRVIENMMTEAEVRERQRLEHHLNYVLVCINFKILFILWIVYFFIKSTIVSPY